MTVIYPEAVKAQGNTSVKVVQTIAVPASPDLSTEINAVSSVDVSCYLYGDLVATSTTNKGEAPRRLCTTQVLQQFGNTTYEITDLQYVYSPQDDDADDNNAAKAALVEGTEVWLIERRGLSARNDAWAAGQIVNVHHVKLGPQNRTTTGDGEFDEVAITQSVIYLEPPYYDSEIVA